MKSIPMKTFFKIQVLYLIIAVAYNLVSIVRIELGLEPWTVSSHIELLAWLAFMAVIVLIGYLGFIKVYLVLNTVIYAMVLYENVFLATLFYFTPDWNQVFLNGWVMLLAILINAFGSVVGLMASARVIFGLVKKEDLAQKA